MIQGPGTNLIGYAPSVSTDARWIESRNQQGHTASVIDQGAGLPAARAPSSICAAGRSRR